MVISRGFRGKSANVTEKGQEKCLILKLTCTDNAQRSLNQKHFAQLSMVLDHVKAERAVERKKNWKEQQLKHHSTSVKVHREENDKRYLGTEKKGKVDPCFSSHISVCTVVAHRGQRLSKEVILA